MNQIQEFLVLAATGIISFYPWYFLTGRYSINIYQFLAPQLGSLFVVASMILGDIIATYEFIQKRLRKQKHAILHGGDGYKDDTEFI